MQEPSASAEARLDAESPGTVGPAFTNLNLLKLAKAKVEQKLTAHPNDAQTLWQMGGLQRKLGDFGAASETYRQLKAVDDDAVAAWWIGALNGEQLPASAPDEPHPTPFVRITNFLTAAQQDMLLDAVWKSRERFAPARVRTVRDARVALVAKRSVGRQIEPWFVKALAGVVEDVARHFRVDGMDKYDVELQVAVHRSGGFTRVHRDTYHQRDRDNHNAGRLLSLAYYFHCEPKGFAGGDLLLYDTCVATGDYRAVAFSRIEPIGNSLVFFPSAYYHEVLPVHSDGDAFENARFTINGWLHRAARPMS